MDRGRRSQSPATEGAMAPEEHREHEPALIGHVSPQLDSNLQRQLSTSSPVSSSSPSYLPNLNFPTLDLDGSLPDFTTRQSHRYPPTPPAALSSLGARLKMDQNMTESMGSLADSQYDMIDDLSEISNDDHETASITSGDDGHLTPEDSRSEVDADGAVVLDEDEQPISFPAVRPSRTTASLTNRSPLSNIQQKIKAENDLIDSYMSEDLETPRQSIMPNPLAGPSVDRPDDTQPVTNFEFNDETIRILFISEKDVPQFEMDTICSKVAACMLPSGSSDSKLNRVVRLPAPPSGIELPTATAVYGRDRISATLQHCIGAEARSSDSYQLRVLNFDGEHSSYFTVGKDGKIDLIKPDVAVFYLVKRALNESTPVWLNTAFSAIQKLNVATVTIMDSSLDGNLRALWSQRCSNMKTKSHIFNSAEQFLETDDGAFLEPTTVTVSPSKKPTSWKKALKHVGWLKLCFAILVALASTLLTLLLPFNTNFAFDTTFRREALGVALEQSGFKSTGPGAINTTHLLPEPPSGCVSNTGFLRGFQTKPGCEQGSRSQGVAPNHIIISLSTSPRVPRLYSTRVVKSDGREIAHNLTQLVHGVWDVSIDLDEAYGVVGVDMLTQKPTRHIIASHDFGSRILQRKTYEKAGMEVSKAVSKDVAVMRDTAQSLKSKLVTELGAGVSATTAMTSQLANTVGRDLLVIKNTAYSMFGKFAQSSNDTARAIGKDFILLQRDLVKFTKDLSIKVKSTVELAKNNSKALVKNPLALSKARLEELQGALAKKKHTKCTSGPSTGIFKKLKKGSHCNKALSVIPEAAPPSVTNKADLVHHKAKHNKATQQLDGLRKRIKRQEDSTDAKMSRKDLGELKKEAKQQEKLIKKMRKEM